VLPAPTPQGPGRAGERVNERARLLLARFRDLGVTGVAFISLQCADSRLGGAGPVGSAGVDPGGTGGTGGGYGVVGPMPAPAAECSTAADPVAVLQPSASLTAAAADPRVLFYLTTSLAGLQVDAARVTGGRLVQVDASKRHQPLLPPGLDRRARLVLGFGHGVSPAGRSAEDGDRRS
jgi:hypothetical protein